MPMTGYVMTENQVDSRYNEKPVQNYSDRDEVRRKTVTARVKKAVTDAGYTISDKKKNDGTNPVTTVESAAALPDNNQLPPTYSAKVLEYDGFTRLDEITDLYATLDYKPPVNETAYHVREEENKKGTGLVVDIHNKPLLPITVEPTENYEEIAVSMGIRFYRPAEAWKKIGYDKPPVWTRGNKRHIPWPKLGPYGTVLKKSNLCQIYDLDKVKKLNDETAYGKKMAIANRASREARKKQITIHEAVKNLNQSVATVPMTVRRPRVGPKFPSGQIPDVDGELDISTSVATQKHARVAGDPPTTISESPLKDFDDDLSDFSQSLFTPRRKKPKLQ